MTQPVAVQADAQALRLKPSNVVEAFRVIWPGLSIPNKHRP
jgi:hypothetical protein